MTNTIEMLKAELLELVRDTTTGLTPRWHEVCGALFEELGGESKLRALKKEALRTRTRGLGTLEELNKLTELEKQIDELERYKLWK